MSTQLPRTSEPDFGDTRSGLKDALGPKGQTDQKSSVTQDPLQELQQIQREVPQPTSIGEQPDLPRNMSEEAVFNSNAFHRLVTYEEKEKAIQVAIDAFDRQRNQYTKERNIVEDDIMLLIVNFQRHCELYEKEKAYPSDKQNAFRRLEDKDGDKYLRLGDPRYLTDHKGGTSIFDTHSRLLLHKEDLEKIQKRLIASLAIDASSLEKKLSGLEGNKKYRVSDFKKDLVKLAVGTDVFDLTKGAVQSVVDAGLQGKKFSDITRSAASGAFKVASNTSECDDGQFVYVNGEKICIPFKATFDRDEFMGALEDLYLSSTKDAEREALDRYEYLLIPRTSEDVYDPNIRKLDSKYKSYLDELYSSYLKYLKGYFTKFGTGCSDEMALPKMNEIYLEFFEGLMETDVDYEFKKRDQLEKALYSSLDPNDLQVNEIITRYVRKQSRYRSDMSVGEYYQMYLEIAKVLGITLDPVTNADDASRKAFCETVKQGPFADASGKQRNFSKFYERYNCFQTGMADLLQSIKVLKEKIYQKYEDILREYNAEKAKVIAEEPTIKGKKQMRENDSRFCDVMKLMGAEEQLRVLYYGYDQNLFPVQHNFTPKHTASLLKGLKVWDPFYDYHKFDAGDYADPQKAVKPDPLWEHYIRIVLPFYRYFPNTGVSPGNHELPTDFTHTLDPEDETEVPDEKSDTYWVKPHNVPNTLFVHIRLKSHLMKKVDIHSRLQKSLIRNFLSLLEMLRMLDEERLRKPGFGTEKLPPMIQRLLPMAEILQPLKTGLMDLIRRDEDTEVPVLRCLQKVRMEKYMGPLRDANYSTVTTFASLKDDTLRNIVEQKLNLTQEQKINLKTAVDCLEEFKVEEKERKEEEDEEERREEEELEREEEREEREEEEEERERESEDREERKKEVAEQQEQEREKELEEEIAKDEETIRKEETEIRELKEAELISEKDLEALKAEITALKQSENVLKIKTRDLSRSVDRRNKDLVQGYDLFQERILQEVADNKRELSRLLQKKENRENQLRLMKILMLETQKKREIEKRNNRLRAEKTKQSMKKVYEQMQEIQRQEQEAEIAKLKRQNHREISKYSKALETLKADNLSLQSQVEEHDARSEQRLRDPTKQIPLTMTMEKPRVKTPRKLRKKGSQMAHQSKGKRSRGKRVRVRSHKRIR